MKRILNVLILTAAINFLLVVAGGVFVAKSSHMDRDKFAAVKKVLFDTSQPTTQETATSQPTTAPDASDRLQKLLAAASGRPADQQVDYIRQTFETEMAQLDRRRRELGDMQHQVDDARAKNTADRAKLEQAQKALAAAQEQQTRLANDKGFQDSLELYSAMPAKQVKTIFMGLDDAVVMQYLDAMEPRTAAKIIKEFKLPDETARIQKVLEKIRLSKQSAPTDAQASVPR